MNLCHSVSLISIFTRFNSLIYIGLLSLLPSYALALESDREQPIQIEADRAEFHELKGLTLYSGNVRMSQGSILLTANEVSIHAENGSVSHLVAIGERAYFEQLPTEDDDKIVAQGEKIEYLLSEDVIRLISNASLTQEGATLNGNLITYDVRNHLLVANSAISESNSNNGSNNGRVRVTIPSLESTTPTSNPESN